MKTLEKIKSLTKQSCSMSNIKKKMYVLVALWYYTVSLYKLKLWPVDTCM